MICAAVGLGTNAFRLSIVKKTKKKSKVLKRYRSIIGLGSFMDSQKRLLPPLSYYKVLDKIFSLITEFNVEKTQVVGTSIFRDCKNKKRIKEEFKNLYGHELRIISPKEEALLSSQGALTKMNLKNLYSVVVDIGGGSTEIILNKNKTPIGFLSIDIGVVTLMSKFNLRENFTDNTLFEIQNYATKKFSNKKLFNQICSTKFDLIMNAGTPTTLAAIKQKMKIYKESSITGYKINKQYASMVLNKIKNIPAKKRLKIPGMEKGREKVIIYGLIILITILNILRKRVFIVSDSGILEGLIYKIN